MNKNLQGYALIAEIAGGAGIIGSLIFVGLQLQQNSEAIQAQTRSQISIAYSEMIQNQRQDQDWLETVLKISNGEDLEGVDAIRWRETVTAWMRLAENTFYQMREGNYTESEFEGEKNFWKRQLLIPRNRIIWDSIKSDFSPDFQNQIKNIIAE